MTRVFTEGFEAINTNFLTFYGNGWAGWRDGRTSGSVAIGFSGGTIALKNISPVSELYMRFAYKGPNPSQILAFKFSGTDIGSVRFNTATQAFDIYVGTTKVASGSKTYTANNWVVIEVHYKLGTSGEFTLKIDGVVDATFTGNTKPGSETQVDCFYFYPNTDGGIDDIAMNDTSGTVDNSWCGDGYVIALHPDSNGDLSQLIGSDGNSEDNYALVNEASSNGDTNYVEGSVVGGKDLYNFSVPGLSGVVIKRIWAEAIARDTVASGGLIAMTIKINSTEYTDPSDTVLGTSYGTVKGKEYLVNPSTDMEWMLSDIAAIQAGPTTRS